MGDGEEEGEECGEKGFFLNINAGGLVFYYLSEKDKMVN